MNLPKLDGPGVLRRLREHPHTSRVLVVVLSAQLTDFIPKIEGLEIHGALAKPAVPEEVLSTVRAALGRTG